MGEAAAPRPEVATWVERVRSGTRSDLARAITLVESSRADHRELTQELLVQLAPYAGKATRIGISGVPGVGKSTFVDGFGSMLTARGHRVAVLAVDPSSTRTGGSILGDKTRMARLAVDPHAFVRPSPTGGRLGGVARATRETMVLVEAAGYDVVLVETVGVGQSEVAVADMVDTFLLLALGRTGDQLQAIKKGILELADVIAVNKADGEGAIEAGVTARDLTGAMRMMRSADPAASSWRVPVLTCSGLTGAGLDDVWDAVQRHQQAVSESGSLQERRSRQHVEWMWSLVSDQLLAALHAHPAVRAVLPGTEAQVRRGELTAAAAAQQLLDAFLGEQPAAG
jgi:LAO/AO transport system kinase